jgi:membrane protease YdiL (CAAX protease family)
MSRTLPLPVAVVALGAGLLAMTLASAGLAPFGTRAALIVGEAALLLPLAVAAVGLGLSGRDVFALRLVPGRTLSLALLCGATFWIASAGVIEVQAALWPTPPGVVETFRRLHSDLRPSGFFATLASLLAVAVAPACAEEMAFRGALLGSLRRLIGPAAAVIVSAVLFGAIHFYPGGYRIPFAILLGLGLGALRTRTGSVLPAACAHSVLNAITLLATPWLDDPTQATAVPELTPAVAALAGGLGLSLGLMAVMRPARH